jgi:hypothetical protein
MSAVTLKKRRLLSNQCPADLRRLCPVADNAARLAWMLSCAAKLLQRLLELSVSDYAGQRMSFWYIGA